MKIEHIRARAWKVARRGALPCLAAALVACGGSDADPTFRVASQVQQPASYSATSLAALPAVKQTDTFGSQPDLIAYSVNGTDLGTNGFARIVVPNDVKAGRYVSNLVALEVFVAPAP